MSVEGEKIRTLIEIYGKSRSYVPKSYLSKFCEDFNVNYTQWNAYIGERQTVGIKIIDLLMQVFPNLNLNWLLKDDPNMFIGENSELILQEPRVIYNKKVSNEDLMTKLEAIHDDIKKTASK